MGEQTLQSIHGEIRSERMSIGAEKIRFPNLNALRFFAALAVVLFHMEHKKYVFGLPSLWGRLYWISTIGYHAVTFFFVLSGFLITYLLLKERDVFSRISVFRFYGRRALRIMPVYFVTLAVAFFVLPPFTMFAIPGQTEALKQHFWPALALCVSFLSNAAFALFGNLACVDQTWSVSSEEQFYLLWPLVIGFLPRKWIAPFLVSAIVALGAIRYRYGNYSSVGGMLLMLNRFGCMSIGALGAIIVMDKPRRMLAVITSPITFGLTMLLTVAVLSLEIFPQRLTAIQPECYSILFCILIVNFAVGSSVKAPLDGHYFRLAGDCSYSAYMYHNFFVALGCNMLVRLGYKEAPPTIAHVNLMLYPFVLCMAFLTSYLSFVLMERPILRFKSRFSPIQSSS